MRRAAERIEKIALDRIVGVVGEPQAADFDGRLAMTTCTEERERAIEDGGALLGFRSGEAGIGCERLLDPTVQHRREGSGAGEFQVSIGVQRREGRRGLEGGGAGREVASCVEGLTEADRRHSLGRLERHGDTQIGHGFLEAALREAEQRHAEISLRNERIAVDRLPERRFGLALMTLLAEQIGQHEP